MSFNCSIRAQFGTDVKANAVHGSSDVEHAKEHIKLVFGDMEFSADGTVKSKGLFYAAAVLCGYNDHAHFYCLISSHKVSIKLYLVISQV